MKVICDHAHECDNHECPHYRPHDGLVFCKASAKCKYMDLEEVHCEESD